MVNYFVVKLNEFKSAYDLECYVDDHRDGRFKILALESEDKYRKRYQPNQYEMFMSDDKRYILWKWNKTKREWNKT